MNHFLSIVLCLIGFASLACAMERQHEALFGHELPGQLKRVLRVAGTCALVAALAFLVHREGAGLGLVMYSGHTSFAAATVYCLLIAFCPARNGREARQGRGAGPFSRQKG